MEIIGLTNKTLLVISKTSPYMRDMRVVLMDNPEQTELWHRGVMVRLGVLLISYFYLANAMAINDRKLSA